MLLANMVPFVFYVKSRFCGRAVRFHVMFVVNHSSRTAGVNVTRAAAVFYDWTAFCNRLTEYV